MSKISIFMQDKSNLSDKEISIKKPKTYQKLLNQLEKKFKSMPNNYEIISIDKNNHEIKIDNEDKYNKIKDKLFIRKINSNNSKESLLKDDSNTKIKDNINLIKGLCESKLNNSKNINMNINMNIGEGEKIQELKVKIQKQYQLNKKYEQYIEKSMEIFSDIFNKINILRSLFGWKNSLKISDLMQTYPLNFDNLFNNISNVINEEFYEFKNHIMINNKVEYLIHNLNDKQSSSEDDNSISNSLDFKTKVEININQIKVKLNKLQDIENKNYKNEINLKYYTSAKGNYQIFGEAFAANNRKNIELVINGKEKPLVSKCLLKKGENNILMKIKNKLDNISYMFSGCGTLKDISELKYLDIRYVKDLSSMFWGCSSLSDIKSLENWNVSNINNFAYMFGGCSLVTDISPLQKWTVSNGVNFEGMFWGCSQLSNLRPLQNWNVINGKNFSFMFSECLLLSDISPLINWNYLNGSNILYMFWESSELSNITIFPNCKSS